MGGGDPAPDSFQHAPPWGALLVLMSQTWLMLFLLPRMPSTLVHLRALPTVMIATCHFWMTGDVPGAVLECFARTASFYLCNNPMRKALLTPFYR